MEVKDVLDTYSAAWGASLASTAVFCAFVGQALGEILKFLVELLIRKLKKRTGGSFRELYEDNKIEQGSDENELH